VEVLKKVRGSKTGVLTHGFAFVLSTRNPPIAPALASPETVNAHALKAPH